jgi:hypothetical protein
VGDKGGEGSGDGLRIVAPRAIEPSAGAKTGDQPSIELEREVDRARSLARATAVDAPGIGGLKCVSWTASALLLCCGAAPFMAGIM